jgi:hypothetical protein
LGIVPVTESIFYRKMEGYKEMSTTKDAKNRTEINGIISCMAAAVAGAVTGAGLYSGACSSEELKQLEIYFLFMYADGSVTPLEKQYLDEIIAKGKISSWEKEKFQAFCGQTVLKILAPTADTIIAEIDQVLGEKETWRGSLDGNKAMQAQTIWTLINLGYADDEYSEPERAVVAHLVDRWEMDPELVAELNDTADTILALTKQKQWIQTIPKPCAEVNRTIQELDRSIEAMFANVETIIAEADIA